MNVLHVVGGLPTKDQPHYQPFIQSQIDSLIKEDINIEILDLKGYKSPSNYLTFGKKIKQIVREKSINLIHAHYTYCGFTSLIANTKLPIVLSLMGSDLLGSPNQKGQIKLRGKFDRLLSHFIVNYVDSVIVKSHRMKVQLNPKVPVNIIPNGVNFNTFSVTEKSKARYELGLSQDYFYLLFLGRQNNTVKNYPLAEKSVKIFINKYRLNNILLLTPFGISQETVSKYMNACDVLLFTSFWEGSPNVVKEAMACNLPIISTDVGDVKEVINDTRNCFVVSFSENIIAEKLESIYSNRERSNGREKINHLRNDVIAKKIIRIYEKILNRN